MSMDVAVLLVIMSASQSINFECQGYIHSRRLEIDQHPSDSPIGDKKLHPPLLGVTPGRMKLGDRY